MDKFVNINSLFISFTGKDSGKTFRVSNLGTKDEKFKQ
jgi:hypothetical protein